MKEQHTQDNKCCFCQKDIDICQIEGSKDCDNPICYLCLQMYWAFNKVHGVKVDVKMESMN